MEPLAQLSYDAGSTQSVSQHEPELAGKRH